MKNNNLKLFTLLGLSAMLMSIAVNASDYSNSTSNTIGNYLEWIKKKQAENPAGVQRAMDSCNRKPSVASASFSQEVYAMKLANCIRDELGE